MKNKPSSFWQCLERLILISTFILTVVGTGYSVRTAQQALIQSSIDLRPWISTPKVETYFKSDRLETRFEITNIGKIPAYVIVEVNGYENGNPIKQIQPDQTEHFFSMMPGQKIYCVGLGMKGESYNNILTKQFDDEIIQSITIKYGTSRNDTEKYWTYSKIKFDVKDLPLQPQQDSSAGVWDIIESDFK